MIVEAIFSVIFSVINFFLGFIKGVFDLPNWMVYTVDLLSKGMMFFPIEVWTIIIANVVFWLVATYSWSLIEWIYKKIPGVN